MIFVNQDRALPWAYANERRKNMLSQETHKTPDTPHRLAAAKILQVGETAPDFCAPSTPDQKVCLHDFIGRPVILVFYPADWSPVCSDQLALYDTLLPEFQAHKALIFGVSTDNVWSHIAYAKARNLHFPLLSDFEPKGKIASMYGVYDFTVGVCGRALFVINAEGKIHWSYLSPMGINPGAEGILEALETLPKQKDN
jgi:peroxiredoxin